MLRVFVYGTLKKGESNARVWPRIPVNIRKGTVKAHLLDLGPFPGIIVKDDGDDVSGEVWEFDDGDNDVVLHTLDVFEGAARKSNQLYRRVSTKAKVGEETTDVWCYEIVDEHLIKGGERITPDETGVCVY